VYAYRLEGYDRAWRPAGTRREVTYSAVPPGHYTFRVKAANPDGVWNHRGASVTVIIAPYFWQTAWFRGLGLATLGAGLAW
jgi:hypothetical protein